MHGFGGLQPTAPTKPTWNQAGDTLESIVHQATFHNSNINSSLQRDQNRSSMVASSGGGNSIQVLDAPESIRKRTRMESDQCARNYSGSIQEERMDRSVCASASATFCRDSEKTTMMTWASFESPQSLKTKTTDEDSACHDGSVMHKSFVVKTFGHVLGNLVNEERKILQKNLLGVDRPGPTPSASIQHVIDRIRTPHLFHGRQKGSAIKRNLVSQLLLLTD